MVAAGNVFGISALYNAAFRAFFLVLVLPVRRGVGSHLGNVQLQSLFAIGLRSHGGAAFLTPDMPTGNAFLYGSIFLAFAYLYPNFELRIMFVLPVKVKWLALLQWIGYGFMMLSGNMVIWIKVTASVCNFLIFFSPEIFARAKSGRWRMAQQVKKITEQTKPRHTCSVCNATNITHPGLQFRYCSKCPDTACFCEVHLREHHHVEAE